MVKSIDFILQLFKWPTALFLMLSIPALIKSFEYFDFMNIKFYAFAAGCGFYLFTIIAVGYNICHSMQVISHELTHTLFAFLTFHDAGRIRMNPDGSGGSMVVKGKGNWLITLSPYFFPLFSFLYMLIMPTALKMLNNNWLIYAVFGYLFVYYAATVLEQVHPKQTDIIKEGYLFSSMVIAGANLYVTGIILAFNSKLWEGVKIYILLIQKLNLELAEHWIKLISDYF